MGCLGLLIETTYKENYLRLLIRATYRGCLGLLIETAIHFKISFDKQSHNISY